MKPIHVMTGEFDLVDDTRGIAVPIIRLDNGTALLYDGPIRTIGDRVRLEIHADAPPKTGQNGQTHDMGAKHDDRRR